MSDNDPSVRPQESPALVAALSDGVLRRVSSSAVFQRGVDYAASGAVAVLSEKPGDTPAITATVTGSEPYGTEVWIHEGEVGGACDCAHAQDGWFCKHQVALALVWRTRLGGEVPVLDEETREKVQVSAQRSGTVKGRQQALDDFLHARGTAELAERLLELANRYPQIARELHQWRKLNEAPTEAAELKALVTELMSPGRDFISWREGHGYAQAAGAVPPLLAKTRERDPAGAMTLSLHAMRRGWAVLQQSDDSDGDIGGLVEAVGAQWVAALEGAGPQPAAFGDTYLHLLLDDPFGCFDTAAAEAAMGEAALGRFRKALADAWRKASDAVRSARADRAAQVAKGGAAKRRGQYDSRDVGRDMRLSMLRSMYLRQLEAAGDVEAALAVMRQDLWEAAGYQQITAFLERHGRMREAFANAELGYKAFPDDWRVQDDLLRCYERDGWVEEALALRRRQFERAPNVERYHQLMKAGAAAGRDLEVLRQSLHAALIAAEQQEMTRGGSRPLFARLHAWTGQRDVSLRAEILCSEGRWDEAVSLVQPPAYCRDGVLTSMARRLGPDYLEQRIALLTRVFESEMRHSKSPYRRELALVEEISGLLDSTRRSAWMAKLRGDYKAKKNFMRDLPSL